MTTHEKIGNEIVSTGAHTEELTLNLITTPPDELFTPLLHEAGILPAELSGLRLLPAVTYGIHGTRPRIETVELLPGTGNLVGDNVGTLYFNPHLSIRTRAHALLESQMGKGKTRQRGTTFGLPSYILDGMTDRYLFVGGDESDLETLSPAHSERLAEAYDLGHVILGGEATVGDGAGIKLGHVSLPSLVREIGQNVADFKISHAQKVALIKDVQAKFEEGKSPDYRRYLNKRMHKPGAR